MILQTAMNGFYMIDMEGRILETNLAACQITGYDRNELVGAQIRSFDADRHVPTARDYAEEKVMKKGFHRFEVKQRHKDGHILDSSSAQIILKREMKIFSFVFRRHYGYQKN